MLNILFQGNFLYFLTIDIIIFIRIRICTFSCIQSIVLSSIASLNSNAGNENENEDDNNDGDDNVETESIPEFFRDYSVSYLSVSINSLSVRLNWYNIF